MTSNHKLTGILQGRTVQSGSDSGGVLTLTLSDGSIMTVQTGGAIAGPTAGVVKAVRQAGTTLCLDYENNTTLQITTAEATSSVMVRDSRHVMEYAD